MTVALYSCMRYIFQNFPIEQLWFFWNFVLYRMKHEIPLHRRRSYKKFNVCRIRIHSDLFDDIIIIYGVQLETERNRVYDMKNRTLVPILDTRLIHAHTIYAYTMIVHVHTLNYKIDYAHHFFFFFFFSCFLLFPPPFASAHLMARQPLPVHFQMAYRCRKHIF